MKMRFLIAMNVILMSAFGFVQQIESKDFKAFISEHIALRQDGKMNIPAHIKHVKLDIGLSYSAPLSQYWLTHEDNLLVFGFEPNPASVISILKGGSHSWNAIDIRFVGRNFFLLPCALGLSENSTIPFYVTSADCGCSSMFVPKIFDVERCIEVSIFKLSDFFDLFPFDTHPVIEYIKIDAQGADLDIAKSAGDYLKERVIYITLEAEDRQYENTANSENDIDTYMVSLGFIRYCSPEVIDPTYFNLRFADYVSKNHVQIYQR